MVAASAETRRRILIVEDEWLLASGMEAELEARNYLAVGPTPSVDEALSLVESGNISAAILDVHLKGQTEYAIADALRQRNIPFLFLTGYSRDQLPDRFSDITVLEKPFREAEVMTVLESLLGESSP